MSDVKRYVLYSSNVGGTTMIEATDEIKAMFQHAKLYVYEADFNQLKTENEALRKDAERYRWLCNGHGYFLEHEMLCGPYREEKSQADLAIDVAMAEEQASD